MYDQSSPTIVCILLIAANQRHAMSPWRNLTLDHVKSGEWSNLTAAAGHHTIPGALRALPTLAHHHMPPYMSLLATLHRILPYVDPHPTLLDKAH
jgi:hypothetical protein